MVSLREIHDQLNLHFEGATSLSDVQMGFKDERASVGSDRTYPYGTIILFDARIDNKRRFGGYVYTKQDDIPNNTTDLTPVPTPIKLVFQLDTYCKLRDDELTLTKELLSLLGARVETTTAGGYKLKINPESMDMVDAWTPLELFRKAIRFSIPVWFSHPAGATTVPLVSNLKLTMNDELWNLTEAA